MRFLTIILFLVSSTFSIPTSYPVRVRDIPLEHQKDYATVHPVFSDSAKYIFFFTNRQDVYDSLGYVPYIISNELRIVKIRDKSIIGRIPLKPYKVSNRNNMYYLNRKLVDDDEFFEVTECFYQRNFGLWFRIIDHQGNELYKTQGIPRIHVYQYKKAITIYKRAQIVTYFLNDILPKSMKKWRYKSIGHLLNSLCFNILYNKKHKASLDIKKSIKTIYTYIYRGEKVESVQFHKFSSFSQKK